MRTNNLTQMSAPSLLLEWTSQLLKKQFMRISSSPLLFRNTFTARVGGCCFTFLGSKLLVETETEIKQKDGRVTPTSVIATKVITEDGTFVGLMYILKDLTLLKQLQLEIQRKDKLAVIGNLAAEVLISETDRLNRVITRRSGCKER